VLVGADRLASLRAAAAQGCDCAVLDDAFQHHRAPRAVDWVLVSADRWPRRVRLLPAGPFREPLEALRRASAMIVTVKAAEPGRVAETVSQLAAAAPGVALAVVRLSVGALHQAAGMRDAGGPVAPAQAGSLMAVSSIGDPMAFEAQLAGQGAHLHTRIRFPDHHAFSASDVDQLVLQGARGAGVVCTLKDAVKLAPRWPAMAAPLWYVSQAVLVESGHEVLVGGLDRVLATRPGAALTAG
jgi:tetraacyldisaccharide 4'-kinase